jgi:rare lipoprotein A (peptidoglycan hydrolase)
MVWKEAQRLVVIAMSIVASLAWANATQAAEVVEQKIFYLDWGFVGRPVSLDVNGGKTIVSWEAGDLTAPTMLMIEIEKDVDALAPSGVTFGQEVVHLTWADPYHLSARGVKITTQDGCNPGDWTTCELYRKDGETWVRAPQSRAYGHVRVRAGTRQGDFMRSGGASWYKYKNCRCAASPDFPKGTRLRVRSVADPKKYTVIRVNDYGPERNLFPDRAIDLDAVAFKELAPLGAGVIRVTIEPVPITDPEYAMADSLPATTLVQASASTSAPAPVSVPVPAPIPTWSY